MMRHQFWVGALPARGTLKWHQSHSAWLTPLGRMIHSFLVDSLLSFLREISSAGNDRSLQISAPLPLIFSILEAQRGLLLVNLWHCWHIQGLIGALSTSGFSRAS